METKIFKRIFATIIAIFLCGYGKAQSRIWTNNYTNNSNTDYAEAIYFGGDSRVYVCGTKANAYAVTISYTTTGTQNWATTYTTSGSSANAIVTYGTGSNTVIYTAGATNGDMLLVK
ncbi:MAG: hypothetical protein AB1458_00965 [Bacteroidota bacterium]